MKHILNDIEVTPNNRTEIGLISDFTENPDILQLSTDKIILEREGMQLILDHEQNAGLFEGIPYRIETNAGQTIEMYVDLTDGYEKLDNQVQVTIKRRKGIDSFRENADGTTWELMKSKGVNFGYRTVYYFVIPDNQYETALTLSLALYVIGREVVNAGKELVESITELIKASVPLPVVTVAPFPSVGTAFDVPAIIVASLKAIFRLILFAIILTSLIQLATKFILLVFPPKRKAKGLTIQELLTKGCQYLGYQFQSTLFDTYPNYTILPVPLVRDRNSLWQILPDEAFPVLQKGYPTSSDIVPTLGSLITAVETMFNARTKVFNGVVQIERRDYWLNLVQTQLQPALNLQAERSQKKRYNTEEAWKRYYIKYQLDASDLYTLDGKTYDYHDAEYSTEPLNATNTDLVTIKGLNQVDIPFSLGARKGTLNWYELIAKQYAKLIDTVTGLFGGGTNYESQIEDRKGYLVVSQTYWTNTKLLWLVNEKQPSNYDQYLSAKFLWAKFHQINDIRQNSWEILDQAPIRMNDEEWLAVQDNNFINFDGEDCEILRLEYFDETSTATITYQKPSNYAQGKVEVIVINE
jgi:hypothetical protein